MIGGVPLSLTYTPRAYQCHPGTYRLSSNHELLRHPDTRLELFNMPSRRPYHSWAASEARYRRPYHSSAVLLVGCK